MLYYHTRRPSTADFWNLIVEKSVKITELCDVLHDAQVYIAIKQVAVMRKCFKVRENKVVFFREMHACIVLSQETSSLKK